MKIDFLFWDVARLTGGRFALSWSWGWGYYRAIKDLGMAGFGGLLSDYKHTPSDVVIMTDGIHIALRNTPVTEAYISKIKKAGKKLVVLNYESIFANDRNIEGGPRNSFLYILKTNRVWQCLMRNADLMVCADPHDAWKINTEYGGKGYPKTIYLPLAIDEKLIIPQEERIWKACFIGSIWIPGRKAIVNPILKTNLLDLPQSYHKGNDYVTAEKSTIAYNKTAGKYTINLNIKTMFAGLQLRIFETMAMGRVCFSHKPTNLPGRTNLHKTLKNVLWYDTESEIGPKLQTYLQTKKDEMINIGNKAREEVVQNHTHTHRIKSILSNL